VATRAATAGLPGLRWRLLHAGLADRHGVPWFRLRQAEAVAAFLLLAAAALVALHRPLTLLVPLSPVCLVLGYVLSLEMLRRLAAQRQERLRVELVRLLYGLAIFVAAGRPVDRALDRLAVRPGELAHELFLARQRQARGMDMNESLRVLAARCGGEEIREAVSLLIAARGDAVALDRVPAMLRALAESVRAHIRARRRAELARAMLRATAYGTLCGLPVIATTVLYPALHAVLQTVRP
jgi:Flp pilus assembly protein TadB